MKANWDLLITVVLIFTCITTPARLAFVEQDTTSWTIVKWTVDFLFLIDIILVFNSAYQNDDFQIIEDRSKIAQEYISGWFLFDVFAIIPFSELASLRKDEDSSGQKGELNEMVRLAKIGRLYKLIKLTKLLRVFKIVKDRNRFLKQVKNIIKLGNGFERLMFITLVFLMITHITACLWIFFASFEENYEGTWMEGDYAEMPGGEQYLVSFYWTV